MSKVTVQELSDPQVIQCDGWYDFNFRPAAIELWPFQLDLLKLYNITYSDDTKKIDYIHRETLRKIVNLTETTKTIYGKLELIKCDPELYLRYIERIVRCIERQHAKYNNLPGKRNKALPVYVNDFKLTPAQEGKWPKLRDGAFWIQYGLPSPQREILQYCRDIAYYTNVLLEHLFLKPGLYQFERTYVQRVLKVLSNLVVNAL